jgi:hypothetical protein
LAVYMGQAFSYRLSWAVKEEESLQADGYLQASACSIALQAALDRPFGTV